MSSVINPPEYGVNYSNSPGEPGTTSPNGKGKFIEYRVPSSVDPSAPQFKRDVDEKKILAWVRDRLREGATTLVTQKAYKYIQPMRDTIYGDLTDETPETLSKVYINQIRHDVEIIVATYANMRPDVEYDSFNPAYETHCNIFSKLYQDWYLRGNQDRKFKTAFQYTAVDGTSYVSAHWRRSNLGVSGEGNIELDVKGWDGYYPIQVGEDCELQHGYGGILVYRTPIARVHAMYPTQQHRIIPDRAIPAGVKRVVQAAKRVGSYVLGMFGRDGRMSDATTSYPEVDVFHVYVYDQAVNETGRAVVMGGDDPNDIHAYIVPSYTDEGGARTMVPTGEMENIPNPDPRLATLPQYNTTRPKMREVTREECMMYPRGRLIICTRTAVLHDGVNPYWHGEIPVVRFTFERWMDQLLGMTVAAGCIEIQKTIVRILRAIVDSANARLNPPYSYDPNIVTDPVAAKINPRMEGQRWMQNHRMGDGIRFPFPPEYYDVPEFIQKLVEWLISKQRDLMGVVDVEAFARNRQTPSGDTVNQLMQLMGPIVLDRAREIEAGMSKLGYHLLSHFLQYYSLPRRLRILGPEGIFPEDLEVLSPANLIPSSIPGATVAERGMKFLRNFSARINPGWLHEVTAMTTRIMLMQLKRGGFPVDPWTEARVNNYPNLGKPPQGTKNGIERYMAWQEMLAVASAKIQAAVKGMLQPLVGGGNGGQGQGGNGAGGGGGDVLNQLMASPEIQQLLMAVVQATSGNREGNPGVGRKPSGQTIPHVDVKGDGRSTISESP